MRPRRLVLAGLTLALAAPVTQATDATAAAGSHKPAAKVRLRTFGSCSTLVRYARRHGVRLVRERALPPPGTGGGGGGAPVSAGGVGATPPSAPVPAPATGGGTDSSPTNVQEAGVDEPDIVKADGATVFAIAGRTLYAVDAAASPPRLLGSVRLPGDWGQELLLHDGRALVLGAAATPVALGAPVPVPVAAGVVPGYSRASTLLGEIDVRDPKAMRVVRTLEVEGTYVDARLNGSTARVVLSTPPRALDYVPPPPGSGPDSPASEAKRLRAVVRRARLASWLPRSVLRSRRTGRRTRGALVRCRAVRRPAAFSGLDMVSVLTIDMAKGLPAVDTDAVMTDAETVYASTGSLYVATQRWVAPDVLAERVPAGLTTAIHKFDISEPGRTAYRASGEVPGFLLSQWALSEHRGVLRAASTDVPPWWGGRRPESESFVTAFAERSGGLAPIGRVGGLGRGERIYAVRFIEDAGFVVTFRQTDPLFTIDLSDPTAPKALGELRVPGYSAYLHPLGDGLLLGVGQDATPEGRLRGTQLSLFDISDLRRPVRLEQRSVGADSFSEVEYDHHAFLWWAPERLAVIPLEVYGERTTPFSGAVGFRVDRGTGIDEVGRLQHPDGEASAPVRRSLVVGDRLVTLSDRGLMSSSPATLGAGQWLPFPSDG